MKKNITHPPNENMIHYFDELMEADRKKKHSFHIGDTKRHVISSLKVVEVLFFLLTIILILYITFRYLIPKREKRTHIITFYLIAFLLAS